MRGYRIISRFEKKPEKLPLSVAQGRFWILEFLEKGGKLEPEIFSLLEGDENLKNYYLSSNLFTPSLVSLYLLLEDDRLNE